MSTRLPQQVDVWQLMTSRRGLLDRFVARRSPSLRAALGHAEHLLHLSPLDRRRLPEPFSAAEVRDRLRPEADAADARTAAVLAAAADVAAWTVLLPREAYREAELGLAADRLPAIVYWHRQGVSACEIGRRLSLFGGVWTANRALDRACGLIAALVNHRR